MQLSGRCSAFSEAVSRTLDPVGWCTTIAAPMNVAATVLASQCDPAERPFFVKVQQHLRHLRADGATRNSVVETCTEMLIAGQELTEAHARAALCEIIDGELADERIGALLVLLQPETTPACTLAAFARVMRERAPAVRPTLAPGEFLADTCGTGSDHSGTFNVSTTIMFVLAAAGMKIAKHGNRGATSLCGSADVLEALGVKVELSATAVETCINEMGIGFMFAPAFHAAFKNVQRIRRLLAAQTPPQLHARTVFNVLGPLANPAAPARQLIGVYSADLVPKLADALQLLGLQRALVAFGHCDGVTTGLDELSTLGRTSVAELRESGDVTISDITPEAVGLSRGTDPGALRGADPQANAEILRRILAGREAGARLELTLLNAGAGLYLGGVGATIRDGVRHARDIIRSGQALKRLEAFRAITNDLASVV